MQRQPAATAKGERTRERILSAAAGRFRRQGFANTTVNEVMRDAGLTHGGFYAHFADKEHLFAEAVGFATDSSGDWLEAQITGLDGRAWVEAWVDLYLSDGHCAAMDRGCPLPTLMPEVARADGRAREQLHEAQARRMDRVCPRLPCDRAEAERRLLSAYAHMAGALMIARTLDPPRSATLRSDVARSVKRLLLEHSAPATAATPSEDAHA